MCSFINISTGLAFSWVDNPEFVKFCQEFIPEARIPKRRALSNRILPTMLRDIRAGIKSKVEGKLATVQCDGWTGANSHHLVAFMVTVQKQV